MKGYYKKQTDGSVIRANRIDSPEFTLDETTTTETYDGWKWFETSNDAYAYFATPEGTVTPRQIRLALLSIGVSPSAIQAMLADNEAASVEWEYSSTVDRNHPLVNQLGQAIGKTSQEIDDLFTLAATL